MQNMAETLTSKIDFQLKETVMNVMTDINQLTLWNDVYDIMSFMFLI